MLKNKSNIILHHLKCIVIFCRYFNKHFRKKNSTHASCLSPLTMRSYPSGVHFYLLADYYKKKSGQLGKMLAKVNSEVLISMSFQTKFHKVL